MKPGVNTGNRVQRGRIVIMKQVLGIRGILIVGEPKTYFLHQH